ncbi:FtsQ-type POTRA domain-containing protein [Psychromonas sp. RZ22]|uniref:cell division protein FtsQ/DivIB n=1 Tax=Psychromonas algarum TaxID=2555643 RepID=UPI0010681CF7|nr:cell division protein FtsQ/DivIB [Psychromonas sp. RZ22]TEW54919.1 FtsQ-type POTRA domain-containing protein [Psychromonas sp. RZ22]
MWQKLKQVKISKWISFFIFLLLIFSLQDAFFKLKFWLTDQQSSPLTSLVLTGDREHITYDVVRDVLIKQEDKLNFFTLEISDIQKQLEAMPWVYSVSIRKHWPDTIKIHIVEQTIVASWNQKTLLNRFGEIINVIPSTDDEYIALSGENEHSEQVLNTYMQLKQLIEPSHYRIAALSSDKRNSTALVLKNGITLKLGKEQKLERIQLFLKAFPRITKNYDINNIEYVDLRYDTGLAVGWKDIKKNKK